MVEEWNDEEISISLMSFNHKHAEVEEIKLLSREIQDKSITSLNEIGIDNMFHLQCAIQSQHEIFQSLTELNLPNNGIGATGLRCLSE